MTLLRRIVHLKDLKDKLLERTKDSSTPYSDMDEIHKHLRKINLELKKHSIDRKQ